MRCRWRPKRERRSEHAQFAAMNRTPEEHGIRPVIDRVVPFDEAPAAFRRYASAAAFGKVVISMGD
ncbi:zinc-binding dehydrogenase [Kitasatospora acidiphila]|uniref:Zinc-binding dehydrogenase n=1 Tax=Kitasatospora acidiphila TaxID=2567942 RepID=A0A540W9H6_9ACTN|nr:zinc-binding dehydrogenase [Kitasatospora acidiphila]